MVKEPFDVASLIKSCCDIMRHTAERRSLSLIIDVAPSISELPADKRACKQMLLNVIANAIKFTDPGGWVRVSARLAGGSVELSVADNGIGIAEQDPPFSISLVSDAKMARRRGHDASRHGHLFEFTVTMGVVAPRLVFLAFLGLTGSIIYNALYLQDLHGTAVVVAGSRQGVSKPATPSPIELAKLPPVSTDLPPLEPEEGASQLLVRAVQRELATRGFEVGPADGKPSDKTTAAISAYEKAHGLPVTGVATDELLRHILLGDGVQPGGATGSVTGDNAVANAKRGSNVKAVQQVLADLGYAPGPVDGAVGEATTRAVSAFQHDRKIAETGRITPELLRELKRVTGRDLTKMAAER